MRRPIRVTLIAAVILAVVAGIALSATWKIRPANALAPAEDLHTLLRHPLEFARNRVTGGIGVILTIDPPTGLPMFQAVGTGSPAERGGLRPGDVVTKIDNQPTAGMALTQIVDAIRGVTAMNVTLTVQRKGLTQPIECVIRRASWNSLGGLAYRLPPGNQTYMMTRAVNAGTPVWSIFQSNPPVTLPDRRTSGTNARAKP